MRYLTATLTALCLLLIAPAAALALECPQGDVEANGTAAADWPASGQTGRCVAFDEWLSEREQAQKEHEAQERTELTASQQKQAAEAHARQAAEKKETGGPPTKLRVTVVSVHGTTYKAPGHSLLYVETNEFAEVFFTFTYPQHPGWRPDTFHFKERPGREANPASGENDAAVDPWSCKAPLLVEDWEVRVKGEDGGVLESAPGLIAHGQLVDDVSEKWCSTARRSEEEHARLSRGRAHKRPRRG